jgi:flagellar motor switch protein FliN/FliY
LPKGKEDLVQGRLSRRIRALGLSGFDEYLGFLERDDSGAEIGAILAANHPDTGPAQDVPPAGPMSLADHLAAMGMAAPEAEPEAEASEVAAAEPDSAASGGTLSQAMIDAMRARAEASEAAAAEPDAGASGGTLSQAMIDAMRARAVADDVTDAGSSFEAASSTESDSGELSLEELMSAGVTPGQPLPGSEALSGVTLDALLGGEAGAAAAAGAGTAPEGDGVEISVAELLAAGINAVPRGRREPRPKAAAVPTPEPMAAGAPAPVEDEPPNLHLMMDVGVEITAEIGSISMPMDEVMSLYTGTILSLNTHAEEPVRLLVNGLPLALGEVVVVDEKFGVRVTGLAAAKVVV